MKSARLKWVLLTVQVVVALFLFVLAQHQFSEISAGGELRVDRLAPGAERLSRSINFPAEVLMVPINMSRSFQRLMCAKRLARTWPLVITWADIVSFLYVCIVWYFIGLEIENRIKAKHGVGSQRVYRHVMPVLGLIVGISCWPVAFTMLRSTALYRQLGYVGLCWGVILVGYFGKRLLQARGATWERHSAA